MEVFFICEDEEEYSMPEEWNQKSFCPEEGAIHYGVPDRARKSGKKKKKKRLRY